MSTSTIPAAISVAAIARRTVTGFFADRVPQFAAGISFYAAFSLAPLLVVMLGALALILDQAQAREFVLERIGADLGDPVARAVGGMIDHAQRTERRGFATVVATLLMLVGATAGLMSAKSALDHIFGTRDHGSAMEFWRHVVIARFKAFLLIVGLALSLAATVIFGALAGAAANALGEHLPSWLDADAWIATSATITVVGALFFMLYRFFPDHPPSSRAALVGAVAATLLWLLGKGLINWYIAMVGTASAFGAAGALAVLMVWIFASANIFLLGAEVARHIEPPASGDPTPSA